MAAKTGATLTLALFLGGCMMGQDYQRPEVEVPAQYRYANAGTKTASPAQWWQQFGDPVLSEAIETALANNLDLTIATARLKEYEANRTISTAPLWPKIGLAASETKSRQGNDPVVKNLQAGFTLAWELDFWGRIRRLSEAANADYLGQEAARQAVVLTLIGSVATSYIQLRELDSRLEMARRTLDARKESERLAQLRFKAGVISEMELRQAGSELQGTAFSVQQLEQDVAQNENELSLLLGRNPGPIKRGRSIDTFLIPDVPGGLPSELLARRPDIQQAEQTLIAANARVGAARANFFPSISLTGNQGGTSPQLSNLFSGSSRSWNFVSGLTQPIFSGGSLLASLRVSEAQREQALAGYRKAIQSSFRDTEDALIALQKSEEQKTSQERLVAEVRRYAHLANLRYQAGVTSHLELLDSQRNLFAAEQGLAQAQSTALIASINLYKALGGDWSSAANETGK
ncbi:MAG: efflux system, outer rane lipoprotein [Proteobacteria bacterium]|nr:efflux system, outer rane lipoprotein [Pseudomonadota bacterium]